MACICCVDMGLLCITTFGCGCVFGASAVAAIVACCCCDGGGGGGKCGAKIPCVDLIVCDKNTLVPFIAVALPCGKFCCCFGCSWDGGGKCGTAGCNCCCCFCCGCWVGTECGIMFGVFVFVVSGVEAIVGIPV